MVFISHVCWKYKGINVYACVDGYYIFQFTVGYIQIIGLNACRWSQKCTFIHEERASWMGNRITFKRERN